MRHIGKWSSTAGGDEGGLNLDSYLEESLPEKDIVDLRLRASCCSFRPLSPPLPGSQRSNTVQKVQIPVL